MLPYWPPCSRTGPEAVSRPPACVRRAFPEENPMSYTEARDALNAQASELCRLMEIGRRAVPGIRIQEQEVAGRLWLMLEAGELPRADWDAWVEDLRRANKIGEPTCTKCGRVIVGHVISGMC